MRADREPDTATVEQPERRNEVSASPLGIIGTGMVGAALARRAVDAGLHVVLSNSRGPHTLTDLVTELGERARAATPAETARSAEVIVAAVPLTAHQRLPREELAGKTVIDPMNYVPQPGSRYPELDRDELTSSELLQRHLTEAHVVKALHNIGPTQLRHLHRPAGAPDRTALPLSGDDDAAKQRAARLLDILGFDTVDLGPLAHSWRSEPNTPLFAIAYVGQPPSDLTVTETVAWIQAAPGAPVPATRVAELAATTERGPAGFRM
ncbi:NADPH-dependent F420 reductase [Nocardia takedensis]|uniref:NADPH-dependent F420 reductase n=1 Tax=Nocardia takedensis TaxID=259390 RepID=UPI003F75E8DC